jgi:thiazole/oxazole-forming peptide maturase SagD family component
VTTFYRHPHRHFWPLPDGGSVVWSPSLAETAKLENTDLWPLLHRLRQLPGDSLTVEGDLLLMAHFLEAQGYLRREPWLSDLVKLEGESFTLWEVFDFDRWMARPSSPPKAHLHVFAGAEQNHGWCFWESPQGSCLRCQILRWLANRNLGSALSAVQAGHRAWGLWPAWASPDQHTLEMVELSQQSGSSLVWEGRQHWLSHPVPLPGCDCTHRRACKPYQRPQPSQDWQWLDPLGLVCQTRSQSHSPGLWGARTGDVGLLGGADPERSQGAGFHPDPELAFCQAVGEALERYAARWLPTPASPELPLLTWNDFSPQQLRQPDFAYRHSSLIRHWCTVHPLAGGDPVRVPAQAMLLCCPCGEPSVYPNLSHGLSCHHTLEQALWGGLWECLERDAVASWWAQLCSSKGQPVRGLARRYEAALEPELSLEVYEIPCLAGRCALAWTVDSGGRRAGGSSARPDESCLDKAVQESLHNYSCLKERSTLPNPPEWPVTFSHHLETYWAQPQRFPSKKLQRLEALGAPPAPHLTLNSIAAELAGVGIHLYWCDLTTPDVAWQGYRVVKVFSPQLLYLPAQHAHWPLGRARYRKRTGHTQAPPLPHPFA